MKSLRAVTWTVVVAAVLGSLVPGKALHAEAPPTGSLHHGILTLLAVGEGDYEDHLASVQTPQGEFILDTHLVPQSLRTGDRVSLAVEDGSVVRVTASPLSIANDGRATVRAASLREGPRRVLVIVTSTLAPPASPDTTKNPLLTTMNEVDAIFRQMSQGRVSIVTEVVSATIQSAGCRTMGTNLTAALEAAGRQAADYDHVVGYLPQMGCGFSGMGSLGGSSVMVMSQFFTPLVLAHELGHNLGLGHAGTASCGTPESPVPIVANWAQECALDEYGDRFSTMGAYTAASFSAAQLHQLGWLTPAEVVAGTTGTVVLSPLAGTSGLRAMVIDDPAGGGTYWFEYRTAINADVSITDPGQVQVRYRPKDLSAWSAVHTVLLSTSKAWSDRMTRPGMTTPGASFTDHTGRVQVRLLALGATATLEVSHTPALDALVPVNLTARFTPLGMVYSFDEPPGAATIEHYDVVFTDATGRARTDRLRPAPQVTSSFDSLPPGRGTLRVTAVAAGGRTGQAAVEVVVPGSDLGAPDVRFSTLASGVRLRLLAPATVPGPVFLVEASSPGYPTRVARTTNPRYTITGLAARARWRISVSMEIDGYRTSATELVLRPRPGGVEIGRLRGRPDTSRTVLVTIPAGLRTGTMTATFTMSDGSRVTSRSRISRNGRMRLSITPQTTGARIKLGSRTLTPVDLFTAP